MNDEKVRILLCEDDENLGMLLREYLQTKGYDCDLQPDGEAGYKAFTRNKYDLCVLDVMMPKKDGFALAADIRAMNTEVPIIFLTAKSMKEDILQGFKLGADDYLSKPFSMEELLYRIESILRRVRGKKTKDVVSYQIGGFVFDAQKQTLEFAVGLVTLSLNFCRFCRELKIPHRLTCFFKFSDWCNKVIYVDNCLSWLSTKKINLPRPCGNRGSGI